MNTSDLTHHMELRCNQKLERRLDTELCGEPTKWIGTWPGATLPLSLCEKHHTWLLKVAETMGFEPVTLPFHEGLRSAVELRLARDAEGRLRGR
jgi:hypothetical protein